METTKMEQQKSTDDLLDEQLLADEQSPESQKEPSAVDNTTLAEETKATQAEDSSQGAESGQPAVTVDHEAIQREKAELQTKIDEYEKQVEGLVGTITKLRGGRRELRQQRAEIQQELAVARSRMTELENQSSPQEDPLVAWQNNPENDGETVPPEVLRGHDAYIASQERIRLRPTQQTPAEAARQIDVMMRQRSLNDQAVLQAAVDRRWITQADVLRFANTSDPAEAAIAFAKECFEDGNPQEVAWLRQLFPPMQAPPVPPAPPANPPQAHTATAPPAPAPAPAATVVAGKPPAAPSAQAPVAPAPQPKEQHELEHDEGLSEHDRDIMDAMFGHA